MIIDIVKFLGSIVVGTGIAFIFAARVNRLAKTKITTIPYTKQYEITDTPEHYEYNQQKDCSIHETTPAGDVILLYDKEKEQFQYYSNHEIPYRYLEVVVRKYVLSYNCIELYTDIQQEYRKAFQEYQENKRMEQDDIKEKETTDEVFVQYKSYNKQDYKINHFKKPIKRDIITFKCMGKIYDYNKEPSIDKPVKDIGFSEYKNKVL
jgi:hypothetical protein